MWAGSDLRTCLAIWKSLNPYILECERSSSGMLSIVLYLQSSSFIFIILLSLKRNHLSILVSSWILSTEMPFSSASAIEKIRMSVGSESSVSISLNLSSLLPVKPCMPWPIILSPFWIASSKFRPIAITSPTLFMLEPMLWETPSNLLRSHLGILQTI